MLRDAQLILQKDLTIERRSREVVFTVVIFSLLSTMVFALSFMIDQDTSKAYGPGVIWVTILFAGTLGLGRLFEPERENDCMAGLLLTPADPRGVYLGKLAVQLVFMGIMELLTIPAAFLFFDLFPLLDGETVWLFIAIVVLGTIGFALIGTLFAAMLLNSRLKDVMLPIIVYPLVTPVLIAGVQSTRALFMGDPGADVTGWLAILGAFDLIYLAVALVIFPLMVRE
ncbi:MAG: heme exporter protein B [Myxococcota bacterium]|jgi:heme exporter protein B